MLLSKAAVTVAIFAAVFSRVPLGECLHAMVGASPLLTVLAFAAGSTLIVVSAWKWDRILRSLGVATRFGEAVRLYTISHFMSAFLPGIVGGDVVRGYLAGSRAGGHLKVAASIIVERVTGLVMLIILTTLALVFGDTGLGTTPVLVFVGSVLLAVAGGLTVALNRRLGVTLTYRARHTWMRRFARPFYRLQHVLRTFPKGALLVALGWSVAFYAAAGIRMYIICLAFGVDISLLQTTVVQLIICFVTMVPITIAGLGTVQATDIYLFGLLGIDPALALAMSLMRLAIYYFYAAIGGAFFVQWRHAAAPAAAQVRIAKDKKEEETTVVSR
jgi:uncharacterized protein (TIRG00374 family)